MTQPVNGVADALERSRIGVSGVVSGAGVIAIAIACARAPVARPDAQPPSSPRAEPGGDETASSAPSPAPVSAGSCDADEPPAPAPRPARARPFVNVIPDEDVELTRTLPKAEVRFGAVTCKAGAEVWYDAEQRVRVCTVVRQVTSFEIPIAANAYTHFHADGRPFQTRMAKPKMLATASGQGVPCAAELVVLSKSGALEHCELERTTTIGKITCRGGESVAFHPSGELAGAVLDRALTLAGVAFPAGTRLGFFPDGKLRGGWLREPLSVAGYPVRYDFALYENGKLRALELAEARTIQGHELPAGAEIELRRDGSLKRAEYVTKRGFMIHGEPWTDTKHVRYDCAGKIVGESVDHWQAEHSPDSFRRRFKR